MCGTQLALNIGNYHNVEDYETLYDDVNARIAVTQEMYYFLINGPIALMLMCTPINTLPALRLNPFKNTNIPKGIMTKKEFKMKFDNQIIPLSIDTNYYGIAMKEEEKLSFIDKVYSNQNNKDISINKEYTFYLYALQKKIKDIEEKLNMNVIVSKNIDTDTYLRYVFSYKSGTLVTKIKDHIIGSDNFNRQIGNVTLSVKNNKVVILSIIINLSPIKVKINPVIG